MGFDVSYHPIDRSIVVDRLIPYIRGEGNIDDLIERVVRISKVHSSPRESVGSPALESAPPARSSATAAQSWPRRRRPR